MLTDESICDFGFAKGINIQLKDVGTPYLQTYIGRLKRDKSRLRMSLREKSIIKYVENRVLLERENFPKKHTKEFNSDTSIHEIERYVSNVLSLYTDVVTLGEGSPNSLIRKTISKFKVTITQV